MKLHFSTLPKLTGSHKNQHAIVVLIGTDKKLSGMTADLDKKTGGAIKTALSAGKFAGKKSQFLSIITASDIPYDHIVLAGAGDGKKQDVLLFQSIGGGLVAHLNSSGVKTADVVVEMSEKSFDIAAHIGFGAALRSYRFDKYRTKEKPEDKPTLATLTICSANTKASSTAYAALEHIKNGVFLTRDLVSEPANVIHPESLAAKCVELKKLGLQVTVLGEAEMKKLGMHSLLGVGQGSEKESKLVALRWNGSKGKTKGGPIAFVGKGVTFDTGGISIKPANGMEEMKWDMGGAGVVIGLMKTLAERKAPVDVVGVVGLVENMPDGNAQRPGDVVKSMSGQTIEVINTDAEGRLVLADALWYTQEKFKPHTIVDLATLTGAIIVALGTSRAGLFSNDDTLAEQLFETGKATGEEVWRLPLGDVYDKQINSYIADMQNVGQAREAGSITAAQFLKRFIQDKVKWAHLDIAGVAWAYKDEDTVPKGGSGFGVRLLNAFVEKYYEK